MDDKRILRLTPWEMTESLMQELEDEGLITRLYPGGHDGPVDQGDTIGVDVYEPVDGYGPHKLIVVLVNREGFPGFATHPAHEEFWLVGSESRDPMYIVIGTCDRAAMEEKVKNGTLSQEDFVLLKARYNDPKVSFFVMNPGIPHGEGIVRQGKGPASFYVTESRDLPLDLLDLGAYCLKIDG